jgi:mono/diheme cytochrome c family protein
LSSTKQKSMWLLIVAMAALVVFAACEPGDPGRSTGSYPIDIFQEMHYNQSHKAQEPPRILPPEGSIPISGGFIPAPAKADAVDLVSPLPAGADTLELGALVFRQNCSMCHGMSGGGDGFVGLAFTEYPAPVPPAISGARIQALTPGETYASVSNGFGFMPAFQGLLTGADRWAIVALLDANDETRLAAHNAANAFADGPDIGEDTEVERANRLIELRASVVVPQLADVAE